MLVRRSLVDICFDYNVRNVDREEVYEDLYKQAEEEGRIIDMSTLDVHLDMDDSDDDQGAGGNAPGDDADQPGDNDGSKGPVKYTAEEKRG